MTVGYSACNISTKQGENGKIEMHVLRLCYTQMAWCSLCALSVTRVPLLLDTLTLFLNKFDVGSFPNVERIAQQNACAVQWEKKGGLVVLQRLIWT